MNLIQHQQLFLIDAGKLIAFSVGKFNVTAGELWRPQEMQELYFKQGKTKTLTSNHTRRLAIDLNIFNLDGTFATLDQIRILGAYWEGLGVLNRWGGNFTTIKDGPHFERNAP